MSQLLIKNAYLITMNKTRDVYKNGSVLIENNKVISIGKIDDSLIKSDAEVYDASGKIIMPGLINTHVHLSQQLGRGVADDVNLLVWLHERVWPYEESLNYDDCLVSSLACCVEQIKCGVTTILEAGGQHVEAMVEAVSKTGIRACLTKSILDCEELPDSWKNKTTDEQLDYQVSLFDKYNNTHDERVKIWFGLRTIFNNSDDLIVKTKQLADKYNTGIHMHIAEVFEEIDYVKSVRGSQGTITHLHKLGVLGPNLLSVHSVWLTDREIDLIKLYDVKVSHCPAAAMKATLGFARVPEMLARKIPVSIGTDGTPCNNQMNLFRDMYLASILHKGRTLQPEVVGAEEILEMVTINASKCALLENEIGSLEVGKKADLVILNPNTIHSLPIYDPIASIVYSFSSENVESTICDGKWLMKEKKVLVIDELDILEKVKKHALLVKEKAKINFKTKFNLIEN
jgi:5-methylthioadenosine/S-adenosylhomocysteine deaminase